MSICINESQTRPITSDMEREIWLYPASSAVRNLVTVWAPFGMPAPGKPKPGTSPEVSLELLQILRVDEELNLIVVIGSVPGKPGNLVEIAPAKIVGKNC